MTEETGLAATVGPLLGVHDEHFTGTAPHGREEDFHGVHLVFAAAVGARRPRRSGTTDGTTDAVAWVSLEDVDAGRVPVSGAGHRCAGHVSRSLDWPT